MSKKRDFIIEKELPHWIMKCSKSLSCLLPFYATQMIKPFLNSRLSANHDNGDGLKQWWNPYIGDCFSIVEYLLSEKYFWWNGLLQSSYLEYSTTTEYAIISPWISFKKKKTYKMVWARERFE